MLLPNNDQITPREQFTMEYEKEQIATQMAHQKEMRLLELEVMKLEAKWSSWLKLPITIIKLPVLIVMAIGYCIAIARKHEPSDNFWRFLS